MKTIKVNITEPKAIRNYILHQKMTSLSHRNRFLVLDVLGATSNMCLCQVVEIHGHRIYVVSDCKAPIRGITSGCVDIDRIFQLRVFERLNIGSLSNSFSLAMQMSQGQELQCYKTRHQRDMHSMKFSIPGFTAATTIRELQILDGRMVL